MELNPSRVWTTAELRERGIGECRLRGMVRRRELTRIFRGHYTVGMPQVAVVQQFLQESKRYCFFTGWTAHAWHSKRQPKFPLEVEVPRGCSTFRNRFIIVRTSRMCRRKRPMMGRDSCRYANPIETCRRLPDDVHERQRRRFLSHCYPKVAGRRRFQHHLEETPRVGKVLRKEAILAPKGYDSGTELKLFSRLADVGLYFENNVIIGAYRFDGVNRMFRLVVEVDGSDYHRRNGTRESLLRYISDRWKGNVPIVHGYRILRYTDSCIDHHLDEVVDQILKVAGMRAGKPAPMSYLELTGAWRWQHVFQVNSELGSPYVEEQEGQEQDSAA